MLNTNQNFVPVLNTEAGLCLTAANWQEIKITTASCYLDLLLLKPGYSLLNKVTDFTKYLGWSGHLVINASRLVSDKNGMVILISPYDGSRIKLTNSELVHLILHIKPAAVLLPETIMNSFSGIWDQWDDTVVPYLPAAQVETMKIPEKHGVYFNLSEAKCNDDFLSQLQKWSEFPLYLTGHIDTDLIENLNLKKSILIESDEPAKNAVQGIAYSRDGNINLMDESQALNFELIDDSCSCPTCSEQLTRAYLHHLLANTPLLCQRFLIQHNTYYVQGN
ncbi:queuine tRNA-ribosyltransferase [Legionella pneumophila]|uniref:Queuine tRNA-ribosyltransferase n=1 Tax=Legionella pneumophila subsp. pascullei TaxID=91890 RepID=A0AAX2IX07_LEGPN|nr:queuine tRNA-ribosyltransferase [Legionella pneumophila]AMP89363.1 queuine tRNA-ribosyltransferase [Legionella pneumophila subsp. pascullei]AMP92970.1 queuine tRNA-ribosyltransferase [Legionella pneumophila subsp. pascullei]AMP95937.1 queuine tRNA-ribosyltransferase [Legionella pneumophila subsp. pascullei]SQG90860.1 queuine tRNA-ribosyltransferase [Legionella pneumophila subsp. pascullei]VEH07405.1 queuine tRNA-ribosyltransferase [Legionella pneumophila subsp. pascullei]